MSRARCPASFGVGIPCYNEAQNIGKLLERLNRSFPSEAMPEKVVILSDGSTDMTDDIIADFIPVARFPILFIKEPRRRGKSAAINRIIGELGKVDIIILVSADVLPGEDYFPRLLRAFENPRVGAAGGRPIPEGPARNMLFQISCLLWDLHHLIALESPKSSEITAFRNLGILLDEHSLVDEAELECLVSRKGFEVAYIPEAMHRTRTPLTVKDYFRQRSRVTIGYMLLAGKTGYRMGTLSLKKRFASIRKLWAEKRHPLSTWFQAALLEASVYGYARIRSLFRVSSKGVWPIIKSAKRSFD